LNSQSPPSVAGVASRLQAALDFARQAGSATLPLFSRWKDRVALGLETKPDGTPVTKADRDAESLIRGRIEASFPGDGVLGEEWGERQGTSGFRWVLDPIDGTASFIRGIPLFGTMIGIEFDGRAVAGVIECPALDERVWGGLGIPSLHQLGDGTPVPARVSRIATLGDACVSSTSPQYFSAAGIADRFPILERHFGVVRGWSDCYGFVLLATGRIEAVIEPSVKIWDVCAALPIVEAAGGRLTDFEGAVAVNTGSVLATNGVLHEAARAALTR